MKTIPGELSDRNAPNQQIKHIIYLAGNPAILILQMKERNGQEAKNEVNKWQNHNLKSCWRETHTHKQRERSWEVADGGVGTEREREGERLGEEREKLCIW